MIAVVQRVTRARVTVAGEEVGAIEAGLLALVGVRPGDDDEDVRILADRITGLRIFEDENGKMNQSLLDQRLAMLAVSQFTLCADVRKGRRPSFDSAEKPALANARFEAFCAAVRGFGVRVATGRFGAEMQVELVNAGPATFILDSQLWRTPAAPGSGP